MSQNWGNSTFYSTGAWTPAEVSKVNLTGTLSQSTSSYQIIGDLVILQSSIGGYTITSGSALTQLVLSGIPVNLLDNTEPAYGSVKIQATGSPFLAYSGAVKDGSAANATQIMLEGGFYGLAAAVSFLFYAVYRKV